MSYSRTQHPKLPPGVLKAYQENRKWSKIQYFSIKMMLCRNGNLRIAHVSSATLEHKIQ